MNAVPARKPKARRRVPDDACVSKGCEIQELFRLLGKAHVLHLLYTIDREPRAWRFVELQEEIGISPNTLSDRLKDLVDAGLLTRTAYNEIPPRVDYQATQKARELTPVFKTFMEWSRRNNLRADAAVPAAA